MAFTIPEVVNRMLDRADSAGVKDVTPMKLQKLVYFAHGWHLGIIGEPLIDEPVEAWKWGPVVRSIYSYFAPFGSKPICPKTRYSVPRIQVAPAGSAQPGFTWVEPEISSDGDGPGALALYLIDFAWGIYGKETAAALSNLTHDPEGPWAKAWSDCGHGNIRGKVIETEAIRVYFKAKADRLAQSAPAQGVGTS